MPCFFAMESQVSVCLHSKVLSDTQNGFGLGGGGGHGEFGMSVGPDNAHCS